MKFVTYIAMLICLTSCVEWSLPNEHVEIEFDMKSSHNQIDSKLSHDE